MPIAARAQALPGAQSAVPTLARAVEAAWERAIEATEAQGRVERARAERAISEDPWAAPPALELAHRDERVIDSARGRETEIGLAWPLWLPGQRAARGRTAEADVGAAEAYRRAAKLRIAGKVRDAAWDVAARRAEVELAVAQARTLDALAADVERRVSAGDLARADALAARSEVMGAVAASAQARQGLHASQTRWRLLTGLDALVNPRESPREAEVEEHPELAWAALNVASAQSRLDLLRVSRRDPPEVMVKLREESSGGMGGSQNSVGVAVRLPFGTQGRNAPRQAAALSDLDIARAEERRLRLRLDAEASSARETVRALEESAAAERSRLDLLRERTGLIDRSFRAGETALPEMLRALGAVSQAEAAHARAQADLGHARARLNQTLGVLP